MKLYKLLEQKGNGDGEVYKMKESVLRNFVVCIMKAYKVVPTHLYCKRPMAFHLSLVRFLGLIFHPTVIVHAET